MSAPEPPAFLPPAVFPPAPAAGVFHVWKAELTLANELRERLWPWLTDDERKRARAFVFDRDRFHFVAGRGMLRFLLGRYLNAPPADLRFFYNREGRPALQDGTGDAAGPLFFNLSHSQGRAVYVFSRVETSGIDLEIPREPGGAGIDFLGIADYFTSSEGSHLRRTPPDLLPDEFLRFWTGKEAVLKAIGKGLSLELSSLEIEADENGLRPLRVQNRADEAEHWHLRELRPWPAGRCTLAYRGGPECRVLAFELGAGRLAAEINEA